MKPKRIDKFLKCTEQLWNALQDCSSEWRTKEQLAKAVSIYHAPIKRKQNILRARLTACAILAAEDPSTETNKYLPLTCYLTICVKNNVKNAKQFLKAICDAGVPFEPELFESLCWDLFDTKATCINVCPEEV